jgi:hypothetical protein
MEELLFVELDSSSVSIDSVPGGLRQPPAFAPLRDPHVRHQIGDVGLGAMTVLCDQEVDVSAEASV